MTLKDRGVTSKCPPEYANTIDPKYRRPITNADRIRAMTDEELAEFLEGDYGNMATGTALNWLQQPYGGADH